MMRKVFPSNVWNRQKSKNRSEGNLAPLNPGQRGGRKTPRGVTNETRLPQITVRRENKTERSRNNSQNFSILTGNQENLLGKMLAELPIRRKLPIPNNFVVGAPSNPFETAALTSTSILYRLTMNVHRGRSINSKPTTMLIENERGNDGGFIEQKAPTLVFPANGIEIETERREPQPIYGISFTESYDREYGKAFEETIIKEQPDFSDALKPHDIRPQLRAKMIDWMIEVFANYSQFTSHNTWFLAVHVFDLYFKKAKRRLCDSDVHLSGVAAMFIATKFEDVYHIPLRDFVDRVAHGKFTCEQIKEKEWEMLTSLSFNVSFPTALVFLERLTFNIFHEDRSPAHKDIRDSSVYLLKMCFFDLRFLNVTPMLLATAVLIYSVKSFFFKFKEGVSIHERNSKSVRQQEVLLLQGIVNSVAIPEGEIEATVVIIRDYIKEFEEKFSELKNLARFATIYEETSKK